MVVELDLLAVEDLADLAVLVVPVDQRELAEAEVVVEANNF
jgi:hypothetical protein